MAIPIVVDTDCGVDDALALLFLLSSPEVQVVAVTAVYGTGPVEQVARNVLIVLELAGNPEIPVYVGAARPLLREVQYSPHVHGENGLGDVPLPPISGRPEPESASDFYLRILPSKYPSAAVLTLGPLTNLALAFASQPSLVSHVERLVSMGGAFWVPGNKTPMAESNIYKDPEAAGMVLGAGVPQTFVALDVTTHVVITSSELAALPALAARRGNKSVQRAQFIAAITLKYVAYYREFMGLDGMLTHDPTAAALLIHPELFTVNDWYVEVDTAGPLTTGKTTAHSGRPVERGLRARVATGVNAAAVHDLIVDRLLG